MASPWLTMPCPLECHIPPLMLPATLSPAHMPTQTDCAPGPCSAMSRCHHTPNSGKLERAASSRFAAPWGPTAARTYPPWVGGLSLQHTASAKSHTTLGAGCCPSAPPRCSHPTPGANAHGHHPRNASRHSPPAASTCPPCWTPHSYGPCHAANGQPGGPGRAPRRGRHSTAPHHNPS